LRVLLKFIRLAIYSLATFSILGVVGALGLLLIALPAPGHLDRKGQLVAVEQTQAYPLEAGRVEEYRLRSDTGLVVDLALRVPDQLLEHRPLVLLMGGQETGRAAVDVIPDTHGVTVAAISYPFGTVPHREALGLALALPRIQRGIFNTPAAAMLALDYLLSSAAALNPGRVELAGISFGAYLAAVPAALDSRIDRLWLIHGGGAPAAALDHGLSNRVPLDGLRRQLAKYLATIIGARHLSPEQWVARVSPRPLVVVNAEDDRDLPAYCTEVLLEAVRSPYEVLWTPGRHVHPKRPEVIRAITQLMFTRIALPGTP
jgi:hypothetical protein